MHKPNPDFTIKLLTAGLAKLRTRKNPTARVRQGQDDMPPEMLRGLVLLSATCLHEGIEDRGSCIHEFMELATRPIRDWGLSTLRAPFQYADITLIDGRAGVPTQECMDLAEEGGVSNIAEGLHFDQFYQAVSNLRGRQQAPAYTRIREFVVRNPVAPINAIKSLASDPVLMRIADLFEAFYEAIPIGAIRNDGSAHTCNRCGSILWPDSDVKTFPEGRCRLSHCNEKGASKIGEVILDPGGHRTVKKEILAYWVGPGLDEILIHDSLNSRNVPATLYPDRDAVDIGARDLSFGIDAKSYSCPSLLGRKLSSGIGGLAKYADRYIAVPDAKLTFNSNYLSELRAAYTGKAPINFMTVSDTITTVVTKYATTSISGANP